MAIAVSLVSLALLGAQAAVGSGPAGIALAVAAVGLAATARPDARAIPVWAASLAVLVATGVLWQVAMVLALALLAALDARIVSVRPRPGWARSGALPFLPTVVVAGVTPLALVGWLLLLRPDLGDVVGTYVPDGVPTLGLVVGALAFVVGNALLEELLWRGRLQDHLDVLVGPALGVVVQAVSFGLQHANGVPRGVAGVAMVTVWGLMLGGLRRSSGGLLAPFVAHVVADAVIAGIVLSR